VSVAALSATKIVHWDGRFPAAEYQIAFQDSNGRPLVGVELQVEDESGRRCFGYPVTDYVPKGVLKSDEQGVITFHHVSFGLEFGGRDTLLCGVFPIEKSEPPRYVCRFFYRDQEIWRTRFADLNRNCKDNDEQVVREWDWGTQSVAQEGAPAAPAEPLLEPLVFVESHDVVSSAEESASQVARDAMLLRHDLLKEETGSSRQQLWFIVCRIKWQGEYMGEDGSSGADP